MSGTFRIQIIALAAFLLVSAGTGCTNLISRGRGTLTGNGLGTGYVRPPIYIAAALPSSTNPTAAMDLVGENGEFGSNCSIPANTSAGSATPCLCTYRFLLNGIAVVMERNTNLVEPNYIECNSTNLGNTSGTLSISLRATASGKVSNSISVNASGGSGLDLADPRSYQEMLRFQCDNIASIPNALDTGANTGTGGVCGGGTSQTYDPIQSAKAKFGKNYYTNSIGSSLLSWASTSASSGTPALFNHYECSMDPKNQKYWADLGIYSVSSDPVSGSSVIYPGSYGDSVNRVVAFSAKQPAGPFSIPIHADYAPNIKTTNFISGSNLTSPIGYGAPIDPGTEACPASTQIPAGTRWVKLWRFRGSYQKTFYTLNGSSSITQVKGIFCAPSNSDSSITPDCYSGNPGATSSAPACHLGNANTAAACNGLAYRSLGGSAEDLGGSAPLCVKLKGWTSSAGGVNLGVGGAGQAKTSTILNTNYFAEGTDHYHRIGTAIGGNPAVTLYPFNLDAPLSTQDLFSTTSGQRIPHETTGLQSVACNATAEDDFIFVVTPTTILRSDLTANPSQVGLAYKPSRITPTASDACKSNFSNCSAAEKIEYNLEPLIAGEPGTTALYPMCVLQPLQGSGS